MEYVFLARPPFTTSYEIIPYASRKRANYDGNFRKRSPNLSIGAAISPTTVSKGGRAGALGWLRVGTNILVRPNDVAIFSLSPVPSPARHSSSAGRSFSSSSRMCWDSSSMRDCSVGLKSWSEGFMLWNLWRSSLACETERGRSQLRPWPFFLVEGGMSIWSTGLVSSPSDAPCDLFPQALFPCHP